MVYSWPKSKNGKGSFEDWVGVYELGRLRVRRDNRFSGIKQGDRVWKMDG